MSQPDTKTIIQAAQLLQSTLHKLLASADGLHAETLVAAAARMAGTMMFRSFSDEMNGLPPGTVMMSDDANQQGPRLMQTMFATLRQLGHADIDERTLDGAHETTAASRLSLGETQQRLEPWYRKTQQVCGLSFADAALASAMATALVIHDCRSVLDTNAACSIAVHGLVESLKTVPAAYDEVVTSG